MNIHIIEGLNELLNDKDIDLRTSYKQLCKKNTTTSNNNNKYKIIRYDKTILSHDLIYSTGLLRSVVFNEHNRLVCFSPPKSIPWDSFITSEPIKQDYLVAEEFVDGTMINVFWDETIGLFGSWELATRNSVGGDMSFFKSTTLEKESTTLEKESTTLETKTKKEKTFRDMFLEAANECNLILNQMDRRFCYSFVLQHPENRIVVPFLKPALYLVEVYEICNTEGETIHVRSLNKTEIRGIPSFSETSVQFPRIYEWENYHDLKEQFASMNTPYYIMGFVLRNVLTGSRTKMRNPVYEMVKKLRGNQPKLLYQYLVLRKEGKVGDFLKYYEEYKNDFAIFRSMLHDFTKMLHVNYISCYIKKERPLKEFPDNYRTHMFQLHKKYIDELKPEGLYMSLHRVIQFVNTMATGLQMYSLHFPLRKREEDFIL